MKNKIHTPEGVRDVYGRECDRKNFLEGEIEALFHSYGYQSIDTPTFEFFDVFAKEVGTIPSRELYKFFDREGNTLVLRPDFTPPVARAVSMYFQDEDMPIRLCYKGNIYINSLEHQGRLKESTQAGVELINDSSMEADGEILALVIQCMKRAGLSEFQVSVGSVDFFNALTKEAGMDEETITSLKTLLSMQNRFGAQELIEGLNLRKDLRDLFVRLPELFGDASVLDEAEGLTTNTRARAALERLKEIYGILDTYGFRNYLVFDLSMVTKYQYYTGIIFQAYTYGSGDAVIKGGRYDTLLERFGKKASAIGFAVQTDDLLTAIERSHISLPVYDSKTMVLYPADLENLAIRFSNEKRAEGLEIACVRFREGHVLDDYRVYGQRNQFGGIIYFRSADEVYSINLSNGQTVRIPIHFS
ncbi:MAG: ATP phosphoribosyltransferase regulatory subunit [Eubacterium sp.]|nr:ATP phosphoribosyltransferase regulatory subunit [Eubacterium sp.]